MKMKRPSVKGMSNMEYLGHFAQDKYIQEGHNTSARPGIAQGGPIPGLQLNPKRIAENLERKRLEGLARPGSATTMSQGLAGLVNRLRASRLRKRKSPQGGNMPGDGGGFF